MANEAGQGAVLKAMGMRCPRRVGAPAVSTVAPSKVPSAYPLHSGVLRPRALPSNAMFFLQRARAQFRLSVVAAILTARFYGAESPSVTPPPVEAKPAAAENSVVKIFSTARYPDPYKPWA